MREAQKKNVCDLKIVHYLIIIIIVLSTTELLSFGVLNFLQNKYGFFAYDDQRIKETRLKSFSHYDEKIGWVPRNVDNYGARTDTSNFSDSPPCVEMYGDSFTESAEVEKEFAWPNLVSDLIGCRVLNFGVGGYGTDQALLRYLSHKKFANIVVMNHLSENIIRNVNQLRNLIYPNHQLSIKPRYIIKNKKLVYVPMPIIDVNNLAGIKNYLFHEYFIPDGDSGIVSKFSFPFTQTLVNFIISHFHLNASLRNQPRHKSFYSYGHSSNALATTKKIMKTFYEEAKVRGQRPLLTIIPTCRDFEYYESREELPYQNLIDTLSKEGIPVFDFALPMLRYEDDYHSLYRLCSSHPNEKGYRVMAQVFMAYLNEVGIKSR